MRSGRSQTLGTRLGGLQTPKAIARAKVSAWMVTLFFIKLNAILDAVTCRCSKNAIRSSVRGRQSLVARLNALAPGCALSAFRSAHAARIVSVPLCFFANALELFLKAG